MVTSMFFSRHMRWVGNGLHHFWEGQDSSLIFGCWKKCWHLFHAICFKTICPIILDYFSFSVYLKSGHFLETCQGRSETMAKRHLAGMIRPGSSPLAIEQELWKGKLSKWFLSHWQPKVSQQCYGVSVFFGWGAGVWTRFSNQESFSHTWKTAKLWNHPGYQGSILRKSNMFVQKICTTYHPPQLMSHQGIFPSWDSCLWILMFDLGWLVDPACSVLSLFILILTWKVAGKKMKKVLLDSTHPTKLAQCYRSKNASIRD